MKKRESSPQKLTVKKIFARIGISLLATILFAVLTVYITVYLVANGPSPTMRNMLVRSAEQASATKWVPGLFLNKTLVAEIVGQGLESDNIDISDLISLAPKVYESEKQEGEGDSWETAPNGIRLEIYKGATFKGYALLVRDPSRVYTMKSKNTFSAGGYGDVIFDAVERTGAVCAINGGAFWDPEGTSHGGQPLGLTYSNGECIWNDNKSYTFIGFDNSDKLIVEAGVSRAEADARGIRDGVSFSNAILIDTVDGVVTAHYSNSNTALAQRTAIGQTADGTVILFVTEGRSATYPGANRNDVINAMLSYGAVTAGMLDGGSSCMMYYPGYAEAYGVDTTNFDQYQHMGLINTYRAFVPPRHIPTFFGVMPVE
ncbi:MAG: phosphodiester glycosidase family protein [Oscillospiraceae bacterium]|jgi:exopolysaccharide biosynthesis protein|nr:phosphodiester glycosidase family protein [Oscillospiraceae bacterium]